MKFFVLFLLGLAAVHCDEKNLLETFTAGNHRFSADVYKEVKATKSGNFLFCPLSAEIILALTRIGAKGNTGIELSKGLHLPEDTNEIEQIFKVLTPKLKSTDGYTLNSANRIYLKHGYQIREDFKNVARNVFSADVSNIDFNKKQAAADEINLWVSEQTKGKITGLIDPEMLTPDSRTVLVNALYFKSTWQSRFDEKLTKSKPFYLNNKEQVNVDMMENTDSYRYYNSEELKAAILEMPYVGNEYSMVIVLPHEKEGLADIENKLDEVLSVSQGYKPKVHVQMPKFKTETNIELTEILKKLGIRIAFEDYADFSGFTAPGEQPLKISDVIQKAIIEVDEKGTTAAASTAVHGVVSYSLIQPMIHEFIADHPFLYYIKGPSGVMFIGRYVKN